MNLSGRVALVTGAGTGIGRAVALAFAREGAAVAAHYNRSRSEADALVREIAGRGGNAVAVAADVSDDASVREMMRAVEREFGRLDYLVNNAGWSTRVPHKEMDLLTDEIWERTLGTNLRGPFYCVRAARPLLEKQEGAAIVNISSIAGATGLGSSMAYAASKGGVTTMTKSLARALAPRIRVNAVAPGFVRTAFAGWTEDAFAPVEAVTPLRRLPTTADVAEAALFLAAGATAITGEIVTVDGGLAALGAS